MEAPKQKAITVSRVKGQSGEQAVAAAALSPAMNAAQVVDAYQGNILGKDLELDALIQILNNSMKDSASGNVKDLESMLIGQANALQTIFVSLAKRAQHQQYQRNFESFLSLALKAQNQSRSTIQAVIDLKYPRQSTYVNQANIAHGPQQVNNEVGVRKRSGKNDRNELLVGVLDGSKKMDAGATRKAKGRHQEVETMVAVNRTDERGGKSTLRS